MTTLMQLVLKSDPDRKRDTIALADTKLLHRYWNTPPVERDNEMLSKVGHILRNAIERKCWIRCDCNTGALMYPSQLRDDGIVRLSRMSNYPAHADHCSFIWAEGELGARDKSTSADNLPKKLPVKPDFVLYRASTPYAAVGGDAGGNTPRKKRSVRQSKLQTLMFWLLKQAGQGSLQLSKQVPYQQIKEVAEAVEVAPGVKLSSVLWSTPRAIAEDWMLDRLRRLAASDKWPKDWPAQGFLLLPIDAFSKETNWVSLGRDVSLPLSGALEVYGRSGEKGHPYLGLVTSRLENNRLDHVSAYLHPVLSTSDWIPVDSGYERDACNEIRKFLMGTSKQGQHYKAQKPLEDFEVSEAGCRPDFIVVNEQGERLIIETMGSDDPEYRRQKLRSHVLMATLGRLVLDERSGVPAETADAVLKKSLWRWHYELQRKHEG